MFFKLMLMLIGGGFLTLMSCVAGIITIALLDYFLNSKIGKYFGIVAIFCYFYLITVLAGYII